MARPVTILFEANPSDTSRLGSTTSTRLSRSWREEVAAIRERGAEARDGSTR